MTTTPISFAIIGTAGVPASYGGFETLAENLVAECGSGITVYCSSKSIDNKISSYKGAELVYLPFRANGIQSVIYDSTALFHAAFRNQINILLLGVSGAICIPLVKLFFKRVNIITNIDGFEWNRAKWGRLARAFLKFSEYCAVRYSDRVIADNKVIGDYVENNYGRECEVIAYGGDHVQVVRQTHRQNDTPYALSVCRIEPENNLDLILCAFSAANQRLIAIGNWADSAYGRQLHAKYRNSLTLELLDPIYDPETLGRYRSNCQLYVHGHSAGGTNPSLVEMMHHGKAIAAFDCNFNRETTENQCHFFKDSDSLASLLSTGSIFSDKSTGIAMQEIANRRYTWKKIRTLYFDLMEPGSAPA